MHSLLSNTRVTLKQLEVFNAVVSARSVSLAARRVGLAQPTISQLLAKMESALGTQLLIRNRPAHFELTPAGEYWYRCSQRVLADMNAISMGHDHQFSDQRASMRFGTPPSLRGKFLRYAAEVAVHESRFAQFESVWALNSDELVEKLSMHQLNCAIVSASSIEGSSASFSITPLFEERIAWVVPMSVPDEIVTETLLTGILPDPRYEAMTRFVDTGAATPWYAYSTKWYQNQLPFAHPYFSCATHTAAIEFVAAGLATCHCPISLFMSLPPRTTDGLRLYELQDISRTVVMAMPRHLLSLTPFVIFRDRMVEYAAERLSLTSEIDAPEMVQLAAS